MTRSRLVRWVVPTAVLVLSLGLVGGSAATGAPPAGGPRPTSTAAAVGDAPCDYTSPCEPVIGAGVGMAVPLVWPWLRGNDGGWDHFTSCCSQINPAGLGTVTGLLNNHPGVVVPGGGSSVLGQTDGGGTAAVVYSVSGASYRYARFLSKVSRNQALTEPTVVDWAVSSDVYSYSCLQRGATRSPVTDCGNGIHQYTRGAVRVPVPADQRAYAVVAPINYWARVVDSRGRPLANPYRRSTGHWLLRAQAQYHGWLWTVEWTVGNVGVGRVAGSSFISGSRIVLTDGPFN